MEKSTLQDNTITTFQDPVSNEKTSLFGSILHDFLIVPSFFTALTYINILILYVCFIVLVLGREINIWYGILYFPLVFFLIMKRKSSKEKERLEIAHSIPYFSEALANALSVGISMDQALTQAVAHLKGKFKVKVNDVILKYKLGKNLDTLLREVDTQFPNTGLIFIIFLLNSYNELGVGISPLLKKISNVLKQKEKADEKIRTILSGGSTYAWLTIGIFMVIFVALGFLLKDQFKYLLSPELKYIFVFLIIWSFVGIIVVSRMTSLEFTRASSMKPHVKQFLKSRKLTQEEIFKYSNVKWTSLKMNLFNLAPLFLGFIFAYLISGFTEDFVTILICFIVGYFLTKFLFNFILKGVMDDQLINTVEIFPEILQIFIIGLYTGLNNYLSFQFALNAVKYNIPKILNDELCRTELALNCGEEQARTWQRLAHRLPFDSVIDFSEIMAISSLHGESIIDSVIEMTNTYQEKKMLLIEKTATKTSQIVIPIIIVAFFPLFIFFVFAPMISKIVTQLTQ